MSSWQGVWRVLQSQFASCYLFLIPLVHFFINFCFACVSLFPRLLFLFDLLPMLLFLSSQKWFFHACLAVLSVSSPFISYIFSSFPVFYTWTLVLDTCSLILDPVPWLACLVTKQVGCLRSLVLTRAGARKCLSGIQMLFPVPWTSCFAWGSSATEVLLVPPQLTAFSGPSACSASRAALRCTPAGASSSFLCQAETSWLFCPPMGSPSGTICKKEPKETFDHRG